MSLRSWRNSLVLVAGLTLTLAAASSCSSKETPATGTGADSGAPASNQPPVSTLFSKSITSVTVEIDYAPGAEPYVGTVKDFGDPWSLFNTNVLAIFDGKKTISFPRTLAKMEKLDDVPAKNFSNQDILDVAAAHRTEPQYSDAVAFYIVFLDGYWLDESGTEQKKVLGVSIGDTGVIGMFKPAISVPALNPTPPTELIEKIALLHFFGHAIGFVDNGVPVGPANQAHIDTENPHHCTNPSCVMSFANESPAGAAKYIIAAGMKSFGPETAVFGQECLSDARLLETKQLGQ